MCFTNFMNTSCIEKNTLSGSSFTSINMRHNTYVTCLFQGEFSSHVFFSFPIIIYFELITNGSERMLCSLQPFCVDLHVFLQMHLYYSMRLEFHLQDVLPLFSLRVDANS